MNISKQLGNYFLILLNTKQSSKNILYSEYYSIMQNFKDNDQYISKQELYYYKFSTLTFNHNTLEIKLIMVIK